jgi:hypothetical protein
MNIITSELISILGFLLPGFITSFLFYSLTAFPKKSEFEAIVIALVYTVIINSLVEILEYILLGMGTHLFTFGDWTQLSKTIWSIIIAILIGILITFLYNNDIIHRFLRKLRITNQTSYPSEWYGIFSETKSYIVLHLVDGRRIMGWPMEWPANSKNGHFILEDADWLIDKEGKSEQISLINVEKIMIDAVNVEMVEFVKDSNKLEGEQK